MVVTNDMGTVLLEPEEIWDYHRAHMSELWYEPALIAENCEGITIWLSSSGTLPLIEVKDENQTICISCLSDEVFCAEDVKNIYDTYLHDDDSKDFYFDLEEESENEDEDNSDDSEDSEDFDCSELDDIMQDRELEIEDSVYFMLSTLMPEEFAENDPLIDEIVSDVTDKVCEHLAINYGISVYRPKMINVRDSQVFCEYPYDGLIGD